MRHGELERLFSFDRWANNEDITALRGLESPPQALVGLLWHVVAVTDNWLSRVDGTTPFEPLGLGGSATLPSLQAYATRVEDKVSAFVASISDQRLTRQFEYKNTSGIRYRSGIADVLQHVILHGVEHRAQIMWEVGKLGGVPVELEYVEFLREELPG